MRLVRPLAWLVLAGGALVGFVALGALNETPLRWGDLSGWLDEVTLESALVEVARWLGIVSALYVIVVAALVLLSELAALVDAVPAARLLQGAARAFAVPALRRRLATASTATAITVSALSVQGGIGLAASPATAELTIDAPATPAGAPALPEALRLPEGVSPEDVTGFDLVAPTKATPAPPTEVTTLVEGGDTMWDRVTGNYGWCDAALIELVAAASGIEDPNLIYTGQTLVFPALDSPTAAAPTPVAAGEATWSLHSIVTGDTLWDILENHYGFVSADLVWAIAAYNGLADPSDIPIGTVITLPPLDAAGVPIPETVPAPVAEPEVVPAPAPAAPPSVPIIETGPSQETVEEVEAPSAPTANTAEAAPAPLPPPVDSTSTTDPPAATAPVMTDDEEISTAPWLVGISSALVLASGLLAAYRRLRRRQATAGAHAWRLMPSGESARLHRALVSASDVSLVRWAGQEISGVLFELGRPVAGPVAVELSDLTGIELLWDAPMPGPPAPWEATPGGWSWRLLYDPAAEVPEAALPAAIPGLVTFGRRDDAQVLIDLEAFGVVSLVGDARAAEDVLRSIVLELGAGDELSDAWVSTVGVGVDGVEQLGRVQARTPEAALDHARGIVADERRLMDDAGVADTFVSRASGPATGREVTVIVLRAEGCEVLAELAALATPRSGLVVVALGPVDEARLRAVVAADGTVELEPLGVVVEGVGVSREVASVAAVLLDDAAELIDPEDLSEPVHLTGPVASDDERDVAKFHEETGESATPSVVDEVDALYGPDGLDLEAAGDLLAGGDDETWEVPAPALLVRVFGAPRLDPSPPDMPRQERMVVAYVAAVGGEASPSKVRDAVWHGRSVSDKRFTNLVGKLRSLLGPEIVPGRASRDRSRPDGVAPLRLRHTMTDLDVFKALAARAGTLPSSAALPMLLDALELVTGEPFDDIACEWPNISQLRWQASQAVETAVLHAVDFALTADDLVAARRSVTRGLVGLPGNEMLYRARMRIEAHAGNHAGVRSVYAELVSVLQDLGGGPHDSGDPSPATRQLFEQLVERSSS